MQQYLTIPGGRGLIRADTIESACLYAPRTPFVDEITGRTCTCVLMIETRRCLHKFNFETSAEAAAVVEAAGVLLSADAGWASEAPGKDGQSAMGNGQSEAASADCRLPIAHPSAEAVQ